MKKKSRKYLDIHSEGKSYKNGIFDGVPSCSIFDILYIFFVEYFLMLTGPRSAVGNVSGNRCESDCRSRGREFDPGPVTYFRGD